MSATDPASLDNLHDIIVPDSAPWWPPAPGWLWVLGIVSVAVVVVLVRRFIHYQANRYRREALHALGRLHWKDAEGLERARALAEMSALLKRTAITAFSRERVASLTGAAWYAFLDRTADTYFNEGLGTELDAALYGSACPEAPRIRELEGQVRRWIRKHRRVADTEPDRGGTAADAGNERIAA